MSLKESAIAQIKSYRIHGLSIPQISMKMGIAKSTISRHVKDVKIHPDYYHLWLERKNASRIISDRAWNLAKTFAKSNIKAISGSDLILIAASLYWAEGSKKDFTFTNTDSDMISLYLYCLRSVFEVKDEDIVISLRIYEDLDRESCVNFWSNVVKLDLRDRVSVQILEGSKKGKLLYGMCRVRVRKSGILLKKMEMIKQEILSLNSLS